MAGERVVVLGASPKAERYSNKAVKMLLEAGYEVVPVHPRAASVHGVPCVADPGAVEGPVDTVTVYLGAERSAPLIDVLLRLAPRRIVLNPGAESDALEDAAREAGIEVFEACTLVLLRTGRF